MSNLEELRKDYLSLMKKCLTFLLWDARDGSLYELRGGPIYTLVFLFLKVRQLIKPIKPETRERGEDWPRLAHTMVGLARLNNVQNCVEDALARSVPGDLIEAGVWRGGVTIFMRAVLKAHGVNDRVVWVADSFAGLPRPDIRAYPHDKGYDLSVFRSLGVPLEEVRSNFQKYDLLDDQVRFLEGWFKDTLPSAPIESLAVIRIDGDLYESTRDALVNLYPKLSLGGYVIIDDYWNSPPCRKAVDEYRQQNGIVEEIVSIDWSAVYWQAGGRDNSSGRRCTRPSLDRLSSK